jgi:hypothetical protein
MKTPVKQNPRNIISEEILIKKSKKLDMHTTKQFAKKRKFGFVETQKGDKLLPEVLSKIIKVTTTWEARNSGRTGEST